MPRLHLVTGHLNFNRADAPILLYLGHDADKSRTIQEEAVATGKALIADRYIPTAPVSRYSDKSIVQAAAIVPEPEVKTEPAPASESLPISAPKAPESPAAEESAPKAKSNKK